MKNISEYVELKKILEEPDSVVIAMYTATWCGPCKNIKPLFYKLSEKIPGVYFVMIDIDNADEELISDVRNVPTFKKFKYGKVVESFSGANEKKLLDLI